uniref:Zeta toxin domain-containing protein n=1 Tax=Chaetoceros debilis TaxID=122233 RepID=A0A7S3Q1U4_9STRA
MTSTNRGPPPRCYGSDHGNGNRNGFEIGNENSDENGSDGSCGAATAAAAVCLYGFPSLYQQVSGHGREHERGTSKRTSIKFSNLHSTHELYEVDETSPNFDKFYGPYAHIRKVLDYTFHANFQLQRQWVQDSIIDKLLNEIVLNTSSDEDLQHHEEEFSDGGNSNWEDGSKIETPQTGKKVSFVDDVDAKGEINSSEEENSEDNSSSNTASKDNMRCVMPTHPWLIYVAGTDYSHRSDTIKALMEVPLRRPGMFSLCKNICTRRKDKGTHDENCRFPILGFILVDYREIRELLPEYSSYKAIHGIEEANKMTRIETGYIAEIVTRAALQAGSNVLCYSRMRDHTWHEKYFKALKSYSDRLRIAILHIVAPSEQNEGKALLDLSDENEFGGVRKKGTVSGVRQSKSNRVTEAIEKLRPSINYYCKLQSRQEEQGDKRGNTIQILTPGMTWESFRRTFIQVSEYVPRTIGQFDVEHRGESGFIHTFSIDKSTEENHQSSSQNTFYGPYAHLRKTLDYNYHKNYKRERQLLQDAIINSTLRDVNIVDKNGMECTTPTEPFLVFTAGAMGAGKSYALRKIYDKGRFPLSAFVIVDPDEIRQLFPEYGLYVDQNPLKAGEMTRKEAGYIVEILTLAALQAGKNVLVDGSLRDSDWYTQYIESLRKQYSMLKIMILHIVAPREAIFARAEARGKITGRIVPRDILELALEQVPKSVKILYKKVDFYCELNNAPGAEDIELMTEGISWEEFTKQWLQTCAWVPKKGVLQNRMSTKVLRDK